MTSPYSRFPRQLCAAVPGFEAIYDEHSADNHEVLPHVLVGALVRFLSDDVAQHGPNSAVLKRAMAVLESAVADPDPKLQDLIVVSFLENLDEDAPAFAAIHRSFGPRLEEQYRTYRAAIRKRV